MSRSDTAMANGTLAGAGRNGLPPVKIYRYRGGQPMAADPPPGLDFMGGGQD